MSAPLPEEEKKVLIHREFKSFVNVDSLLEKVKTNEARFLFRIPNAAEQKKAEVFNIKIDLVLSLIDRHRFIFHIPYTQVTDGSFKIPVKNFEEHIQYYEDNFSSIMRQSAQLFGAETRNSGKKIAGSFGQVAFNLRRLQRNTLNGLHEWCEEFFASYAKSLKAPLLPPHFQKDTWEAPLTCEVVSEPSTQQVISEGSRREASQVDQSTSSTSSSQTSRVTQASSSTSTVRTLETNGDCGIKCVIL